MKNKAETKDETAERILISPLGMSKGLLYSALVRIKPSFVFIITSAEAVGPLEEIKARAGFNGDVCSVITDDPFDCYKEKEEVFRRIFGILSAGKGKKKIEVNITGGTTAIQYIVQYCSNKLKENGFDVTEYALIDRRPADEQKNNPYTVGELIVLSE
ncbi:hypothetical protein [Thermincola ferriacetica]